MKKKFLLLIIVAAVSIVCGGIALFCINPPAPISEVTEELKLDHSSKCLKI